LKLLFEQNLSRKLVSRLADIFPDSSHVQFHGLLEADDGEIWEFAKAQGCFIVTQDADFADRSRLYGVPPKVVWLRCGNVPTSRVEALLCTGAEAIQELMSSLSLDCLELH
jgi:predicted nuclease of predicted toxin-antitoxin system